MTSPKWSDVLVPEQGNSPLWMFLIPTARLLSSQHRAQQQSSLKPRGAAGECAPSQPLPPSKFASLMSSSLYASGDVARKVHLVRGRADGQQEDGY